MKISSRIVQMYSLIAIVWVWECGLLDCGVNSLCICIIVWCYFIQQFQLNFLENRIYIICCFFFFCFIENTRNIPSSEFKFFYSTFKKRKKRKLLWIWFDALVSHSKYFSWKYAETLFPYVCALNNQVLLKYLFVWMIVNIHWEWRKTNERTKKQIMNNNNNKAFCECFCLKETQEQQQQCWQMKKEIIKQENSHWNQFVRFDLS